MKMESEIPTIKKCNNGQRDSLVESLFQIIKKKKSSHIVFVKIQKRRKRKMDTKLKWDLHNAGNKSQYDAHAKKILSNRKILAHILHRVVDEVKDMSIEEIETSIQGEAAISSVPVMPNIIGSQQEDSVDGEDTVFFDLRFVIIRKDTDTKIIFDVEAQKSYHPGYHVVTRGIVYCSRMVSSQVDTEFMLPHYDDLKKVYSIWLCFNAPQKIGNAISRFRITKEELLGHTDIPERAYDKLEIVQICLREDSYEHEDELICLLNTIFSTKKSFSEIENSLENDYNIPMKNNFGEEVRHMCNLSEGIEQKGIEKGIQKGIISGYQSLYRLMQKSVITLAQALDAVENKEDFQKWLKTQK